MSILVSFNILTKYITNKSKTKKINSSFIELWNNLFELAREELTKYKYFMMPYKLNPNIILTITSCKRLNLFIQTINSIINTWKDIQLIDQFLVIDDNSSIDDRNIMIEKYKFIKFIMKTPEQKGHMESMNIIYDILKEHNPTYWIHMEDDFLFFNELPYVTLGIQGLDELSNFNVKQIMFNRNYIETFDKINMDGHIPYFNTDFSLHDYKHDGYNCQYWPNFSFRPSIIDTECILQLGNFTSHNPFFEMDYAKKWSSKGYRTGFINTVTNIHIGKLCNDPGENAYTLNDVPQFVKEYKKDNIISLDNDIFTKSIRIINLKNRPDRLIDITDKLHKVLNDSDLVFNIFDAIDGKELFLDKDLLNLFRNNDFNFRRGIVGCALSHYNLWKQLVNDNNNDYYIIIEDDCTFCDKFKEKITNCILNINEYSIIFLGYHMYEYNKIKYLEYNSNDYPKIQPINKKIYIGGTHCYIINKYGANALLDFINVNGITNGIDYLMVKVQEIIKIYETVPHLSFAKWVEPNKSDVDSDIQYDYNSLPLNVSDNYIFLKGLDQIGNDCYMAESCLSKCDYELMADSIEGCIAFNTLGYFKNKITDLIKSPYFKESDGIYINKYYYIHSFKKKE
jgi:GR25 family glycosyltransferase involved in LPS biosynthesis